jgi:hypothetical protein
LELTPESAATETGSLRLVHTGGGYDQTLAISSNAVPIAGLVEVLFKDVPKTDNYTLTYVTASGTELPIFSNVPFSALQDYTPPAQSAPASNN